MKIALNMGQNQPETRETHLRAIERDILAVQKGDWQAKNSLSRVFLPLLTSLAEKRSADRAQANLLIEAGKEGLFTAARKYRASVGAERFQIFALEFIEKGMDRALSGRSGGFFARLFGR